jgi:serine/threonine-protein kinase
VKRGIDVTKRLVVCFNLRGVLLSEEVSNPRLRDREARSGTVIAGRYAVERLIARGGMASVYLASQVGLDRPVAIKILSPPPDADQEASFEERFRLEASTLAGLDHRNIVTVHDFGETSDDRFFIAMEYVDGPRLSDLLRGGPLDPDRAVRLMLQVCAALRYAHRKGVVHRDIKPSNLLIRKDDNNEDEIKVVDFGLVKLAEHEQTLTRAGLILGSPHCMAPEQIRGLDVDHRADIYGVGVVLYRCLVGKYPFHGENSTATMIAHLNEPVPPFAEHAPNRSYPPDLEDIVTRCLGKKPGERFDSTQELMEELAACLSIPIDQYRFASQSHSTITRATTPIDFAERTTHGGSTADSRKFLALAALIGVGLLITLTVAIVALVVVLSQAELSSTAPITAGPVPVQDLTPAPRPTVPEPIVPDPAELPAPDVVSPDPQPVVSPRPQPVVSPRPQPVASPRPLPAVTPSPEPRPEPITVAPEPVAPEPVAPEPVAPEPAAPEPAEDNAPAGYLDIPDDF